MASEVLQDDVFFSFNCFSVQANWRHFLGVLKSISAIYVSPYDTV